jgi:glutathione peroxidase
MRKLRENRDDGRSLWLCVRDKIQYPTRERPSSKVNDLMCSSGEHNSRTILSLDVISPSFLPLFLDPSRKYTMMLRFLLFALLLPLAACVTSPDKHEECAQWAEQGECDDNPGYMVDNCVTSCDLFFKQAAQDDKDLEGIDSFFDLSALDIVGNLVPFKQFEGDVTILTNVASFCGFTDSHYKGLVQLWNQVKHTGRINLLAFPCNQFGEQEPKKIGEIADFAVTQYGVDFTMMDKIDVNGPQASSVYKFLKREAGPPKIGWNFATYFVVGPDGTVQSHDGVEPMDLKDIALNLIAEAKEL